MLGKVLLLFLLAGVGRSDGPLTMSLQVLYESKCPDSRSFVLNQLEPAMQLLQEQVQLKLVPFGKARSINGGYNGFQCQHGQSECQGNVIQDCALNLMADRSDVEKTAYVACEMNSYAAARGSVECVVQANVSTQALSECLSSGRGTSLQLESERITNYYRPKFIPTIAVNGIFNQRVQDCSQYDLIGTLCSILKHTGACAQYYNNNDIKCLYV